MQDTSLSLEWCSQFATAGFANQSLGLIASFSPKPSFLLSLGREFSSRQKTFKSPWNIFAKGTKKYQNSLLFFYRETGDHLSL